jgi:hypothetical protein
MNDPAVFAAVAIIVILILPLTTFWAPLTPFFISRTKRASLMKMQAPV